MRAMPAESVACAAADSSVTPARSRTKTLTLERTEHPAVLAPATAAPSGSQASLLLRENGPPKRRGMMPTTVVGTPPSANTRPTASGAPPSSRCQN